MSEISASKDNFFNATNHQFQYQNTETFPFPQFIRTERVILLCNPFAEYTEELQNISGVTNQSLIHADHNN